jgi:hypothetical protein
LTRSGDFRQVETLSVEGVAWALAATGDAARAARMLGAATAMRAATEDEMPPSRRQRLEEANAAARGSLGADAFATAFAAGETLERDAATAEALALARALAAAQVQEAMTDSR